MYNTNNTNKNVFFYFYGFFWSIILTFFSFKLINYASYDYDFHLTRIVGLAQSIANRDFLPNLNFLFSYGTGYPVPMFYGNWQLYIPAITFIVTKSATFAYLIYGFFINFSLVTACIYVYSDISKDIKKGFLLACITPTMFIFFGFGMSSETFLAVLILHSIYLILFKNKKSALYLGVTTSLLIQSHVLSTLILAIYSLVFVLFNFKLLNKEKIISFVKAFFVCILLSVGYFIQFIEQTSSQNFFFKWNMRNFPFESNNMFQASNIIKTLSEQINYGGFRSITSPLISFLLTIYIVFLLKNKLKSTLLRSLSFTIITLFIFTTNLLPWKVLQNSFLGALQYPYRLTFFLPILIFISFSIALSLKQIKFLSLTILLLYFSSILIPFYNSSDNYIQRNSQYLNSYKGDRNIFNSPVGDEYYTVDVNHSEIRNPSFKNFENINNVEISNVKYAYNELSFNFNIVDPTKKATVILPLVWYKGYQSNYYSGGLGSVPELSTMKLTTSEKKQNLLIKKLPKNDYKILHSGKIKLSLSKSGSVKIHYEKTIIQKIGFILEYLFWCFSIFIFIRSRLKKVIK